MRPEPHSHYVRGKMTLVLKGKCPFRSSHEHSQIAFFDHLRTLMGGNCLSKTKEEQSYEETH